MKNNYGQPAQSQQQTYFPAPPIDVTAKVTLAKKMIKAQNLNGGPWFFYSGFAKEVKDVAFEAQKILSNRLGVTRKIPTGETDTNGNIVLDKEGKPLTNDLPMPGIAQAFPTGSDPDRARFADTPEESYYWAAPSRAYSQAITGKVYVVIPAGRPVNKPKDNGDGSVWWRYVAIMITYSLMRLLLISV